MVDSQDSNEIVLRGLPASPGVEHGRAFVLMQSDLDLPAYIVEPDRIDREIERFEAALIETREQISVIRQEIAESLGEAEAQIFDAHLLVLEDRALIEEVIAEIRSSGYNIEQSFHRVANRYIEFFDKMDDPYLKERVADIRDVTKRLLGNLMGRGSGALEIPGDRILVTGELTPSDAAQIDRGRVLAIATDSGGQTSHAVIMARSIQVPGVVGLHDITTKVASGDMVLVDGYEGVVIVNPSEQTLYRYGQIQKEKQTIRELFLGEAQETPVTTDGVIIQLRGNVEGAQDLEALK
ncbi:MAG: phosphoenolpyruvate-utilizing N-terminal domain-containing protein, partial [Verrucomicrobiota bacterium]